MFNQLESSQKMQLFSTLFSDSCTHLLIHFLLYITFTAFTYHLGDACDIVEQVPVEDGRSCQESCV